MGRDPNTPAWVQHLALQMKDRGRSSPPRRVSRRRA